MILEPEDNTCDNKITDEKSSSSFKDYIEIVDNNASSEVIDITESIDSTQNTLSSVESTENKLLLMPESKVIEMKSDILSIDDSKKIEEMLPVQLTDNKIHNDDYKEKMVSQVELTNIPLQENMGNTEINQSILETGSHNEACISTNNVQQLTDSQEELINKEPINESSNVANMEYQEISNVCEVLENSPNQINQLNIDDNTDSNCTLEQAIFGSVQDRNRITLRKPCKIPYKELSEEIKTYSFDLDMYNSDYQYHLLMQTFKESVDDCDSKLNSSTTDTSLAQIVTTSIPIVENEEIPSDKTDSKEIIENKQTETIIKITEEIPSIGYQEIRDAECQLAYKLSQKILTKTNENNKPVVQKETDVMSKTIIIDKEDELDEVLYMKSKEVVDNFNVNSENDVQETETEKPLTVSDNVTIFTNVSKDNENSNVVSDAPTLTNLIVSPETKFTNSEVISYEVPIYTYDERALKGILLENTSQLYHQIKDAETLYAYHVTRKYRNESSETNTLEDSQLTNTSTNEINIEENESQSLSPTNDKCKVSQNLQSSYEMPTQFSYHEIKDAENLFALTRKINQPETQIEIVESSDTIDFVKPSNDEYHCTIKNDDINDLLAQSKEMETIEREVLPKIKSSTDPIYEIPRHCYQNIQDGETTLASLLDINPHNDSIQNQDLTVVTENKEESESCKDNEIVLLKSVTPINSVNDITLIQQTVDFIASESNEPLSTLKEDSCKTKNKEVCSTGDLLLPDNQDKVSASSTNIINTSSIEPLIEEQIPVVDDLVLELADNKDISTEKIIQIEDNLKPKNESPISELTMQEDTLSKVDDSFEIDNIDDTLVSVVFGDIKSTKIVEEKEREVSFDNKLPLDKLEENIEISHKDMTDVPPQLLNEAKLKNQVSQLAKGESSTESAVTLIGQFESKPTIDLIQSEILHSTYTRDQKLTPEAIALGFQSATSDTLDSSLNLTSEQTNLESLKIADNISDISEIETSHSRPEKSPIHSLHDLLPEIDSIPEFKPSFSNTVLYSNLSADAPEFTPSYMYRNVSSTVTEDKISKDSTMSIEKEEPEISKAFESTENVSALTNVVVNTEIIENPPYSPIVDDNTVKGHKNDTEDSVIIEQKHDSMKYDEAISEEQNDAKLKRNKKKKKEKKYSETSTTITSESLTTVPTGPGETSEPVNIWAKIAEEGKSYADVVAEGLSTVEHKDRDFIESSDEILNIEKIKQISLETEDPETTKETSQVDTNVGSWAKIVAANRPSPDRVDKSDIQCDVSTREPKHTPIILIDESEFDDSPKVEKEVDEEGFITVDRHRRSRSRSRDNRSQSKSKMADLQGTRDKSENRFEALTGTLKQDEVESVQEKISESDQHIKKEKERKSHFPKTSEIDNKIIEVTQSTSDEDRQISKKDKKKRSSKSKSQPTKPQEICLENITSIEVEPNKMKIEVSELVPEIQALPQIESKENKKKNKKKKKYQKNDDHRSEITEDSVQAPVNSPLNISETYTTDSSSICDTERSKSQSEIKKLDNVTYEKPTIIEPIIATETNLIKTPTTPESLQTPVKDRVYSDAQYWKIDPSGLDDLKNLSEVLTVEYIEPVGEPPQVLQISCSDQIDNSEIETESTEEYKITKEMPTFELNKKEAEVNKITEEQSLENKMADLQREIEEMLLPENDSASISDTVPININTSLTSKDKQKDNLSDISTIKPQELEIESPEIKLTSTISESFEVVEDNQDKSTVISDNIVDKHISEHIIYSLLTESEPESLIPLTIQSQNETELSKQIDSLIPKLITERADAVNLIQTTPIESFENKPSLIITTNNTFSDISSHLKPENFWTEKCAVDDAERLLHERNLENLKCLEQPLKNGSNLEENLKKENSFWLDKHLYNDAEYQYYLLMAKKTKTPPTNKNEIEIIDRSDKDKDPSSGSGNSSETEEPRDSCDSLFDSNYISMDLPGGICSWKDQSSYLSLDTPSDSLTGLTNQETPRLGTDILEDILTTSTLEPVALSLPPQEMAAAELQQRTAKDELSNDIESLLEEVRNIQTRLSDLPDESLHAMEDGLREGIEVLVKCEEAAELLETKIMEYRQEQEIQTLLKELIIIKAKISKLLTQARQGLDVIQDAKLEVARQAKVLEEHKENVSKLDNWLESINKELTESTKQSEALTEEDIIKYIEVYERYIREYEEYEIILKSITITSDDESSHVLREKLNVTQKTLAETKNLVIIEIERLRQVLLEIRSVPEPELIEDDISQTDRTIDSTSMPEEIVSPRDKVVEIQKTESELDTIIPEVLEKVTVKDVETQKVRPTVTIDTQTGKSLMSDSLSVTDKSILCQPDTKTTQDVATTCAPPQDIEIQTSEPHSQEKELLESIQVRQIVSDGHETIEIASRPIHREEKIDEQSLLVDANYRGDDVIKDSQLNIIHSLPQSFETVMVEPDETTTEVVVDADGTKRIIVKKIRKTLVTRQQTVQTQQHRSQILSKENIPEEQSFSQITLQEDKGSTSTALDDGGIKHIQYETYGGQVISGLPGGEVTIQEFTSKPDMVIRMEQGMKPEEILQIAEGEMQPHIQTSSSSVTAVVQQVTKRIIKTRRRIIRRVVIIDGKEHVTEEIIEEPDNVEVFEEQIPRVSISVKDQGGVQFEEIDDHHDKDDGQPPTDHSELYKDPEIPKDWKSDSKDKDTSRTHSQPREIENTIQMSQKSEKEPNQIVTVTETPQTEIKSYDIQEPEDSQTVLVTGGTEYSSTEHSSNVATIVQKVTRKITRTKRRIIKHIQIIDGKEHVTEEVIEEPDDVEIVEEEPKITHNIQTQGVKTKRIKIIRQVQIIDGKEHVTEQVVEEPDDDFIPESTMTAEIDVTINKPTYLEKEELNKVIYEKQPQSQLKDTSELKEDLEHKIDYIDNKFTTKVPELIDVTKETIEIPKPVDTTSIIPEKSVSKMVPSEKGVEDKSEQNLSSSDIKENKDKTLNSKLTIKQDQEKNKKEIVPEQTSIFMDLKSGDMPTKEFSKHIISSESDSTVSPKKVEKETSVIDVTKALISNEMEHSSILHLPVDIKTGVITKDSEATPISTSDFTDPTPIATTLENSKLKSYEVPENAHILIAQEDQNERVMNLPKTIEIYDTTPQEFSHIKKEDQIKKMDEIRKTIEPTINVIDSKGDHEKDFSTKEINKTGKTTVKTPTDVLVAKETIEKESTDISITSGDKKISDVVGVTVDKKVSRDLSTEGLSLLKTDLSEKHETSDKYPLEFKDHPTDKREKTEDVNTNVQTRVSILPHIAMTVIPDKIELPEIIPKDGDQISKTENASLPEKIKEEPPLDYIKSEDTKGYNSEIPVEEKNLYEITKELIIKESNQNIVDPILSKVELPTGHIVTENAPVQISVEVEPLTTGTVIVETMETSTPEISQYSYISKFEPKAEDLKDSFESTQEPIEPLIHTEESMPSEFLEAVVPAPSSKSDNKSDTTLLLESERQDTHLREFKDKNTQDKEIKVTEDILVEPEKIPQTVNISMSISKNIPKKTKPKVQFDIKVEDFKSHEPTVVKKDIEVNLPLDIKVTEEHIPASVIDVVEKKESVSTKITPEEIIKDHKRSKKRKKHKQGSEDSEAESRVETDKSITDSESTSLSHYVELPASPAIDSPKPSIEVLEPSMPIEQDSPIMESEPITEEKGYEPDEVSLDPIAVPERKKKQKKRKQHVVSEETTYPKLSTTDSDDTSITTPTDIKEPKVEIKSKDKKKKSKKRSQSGTEDTEIIPEKPLSPKIGSEVLETSPRDESYHTMSEVSESNTVKIVEECVQSSPEIVHKEVHTTITYPIPVVEEVVTQEYSVQTSPEVSIDQVSIKEDIEMIRPETVDIVSQTSPTPLSESLVQTTPVEDKEAHTQTLEEITVVEKVQMSDSEIQTSRTESPEKIVHLEATTQVFPQDITIPEEKCSQTSSPIEETIEKEIVLTDTKEMQTSPLPEIQKDEKSTEIFVETSDTDIQTVKHEIIDRETSTTPPKETEITEISIQTPEIPLVSTFTQSDEFQSKKEPEEISTIKEIITVDTIQQTSPRDTSEEIPDQDIIKTVETVDSIQQTSPRIDDVPKISENQSLEFLKNEILTIDNTQQTSPRDEHIEITPVPNLESIKMDITTVDTIQQTSPRDYSETSISTSTDEPYEVHLRAQISIPQTMTDFIESERQYQEQSHSIVGDKQKQKKKKQKKKSDSPTLHSPESLSDPITTELSMSITPTSEDISSKDSSSIDEGIYQGVSPMLSRRQENVIIAHPKLTYSDVVQRSKSKSPSPTKTVPLPRTGKAKLLDTLQKRIQSIIEPQRKKPDDSMALVLYEPSVEKSYDLIVNKEIDELKDAIENNDSNRSEKSVIIVIETISIWLEEIQYKIQRDTITGNENTQDIERLQSLQSYVKSLKEIIEEIEVNEEIITLIDTLTYQVHVVTSLTKESSNKIQEGEGDWNTFLNESDNLHQNIQDVKSSLDDIIISDIPIQQKLDKLDKLELDNADNSDNVKKLFSRYRVVYETNSKRECPSSLYSCDDDTKQIENAINTERDRLLQLTSLAEEYEQTLQDFGQITDVAEALLDGKIIVSNLDHLHEEIQKHRKFFVNLSHCRAILESLEDNLDSETKSKYASLHNSLHDRATIIIDRAASRAQQMTLAASKWTMLEQGMKTEKQWLVVAQQRVPDLSNVTSMDHEQYINLYQSLSLDISHHYAKMLRLMSITESLQNLIICSGMETDCSVALDTLLKLQEDVESRLTRLTAFKENWIMYDHLIDRIESWMKVANREIENITPENITTTSNLRRFWELKAQHEVHNNLKNESGLQFDKALEILPISDEMVQRQFFSKIEDKWRDLANRIGDIHASAIQNISDRDVTSGEKLNILEEEIRELRSSLDNLKGVIKSEDELNLYIERLQVMTGRIDRIQNELGRLSLLPTAESERLGTLLTQSGILDDQISEELERSLLLKEKIVQVQAGIIRCQKSQRRARLTLEECEAAERLGSDVVERASDTCEKLIEDLASQWRDILALRQALHTLPISLRVCVSPTSIERDISALQETHADLETACNDLSARLRSKVQLWRRFERQLEMVQGAVREADYMVELLTVQGQVDYDRLLKATEKLETLNESLTRRSGELVGQLKDAAAPLEASTDPAVAVQLRRELDEAAAAYDHTCSNLTQLCDKYHRAVELWKRYRDAAAAVRTFAEFMEGQLHALRPDDAPATAQACLEQESRVAELRSLAAQVAAETGSRALQADADALARRLQLVAGAVQVLADLGEARQLARAKALHAKEKLCDMRQDLAPLHEDGEIVEDKLVALRDNLIALGKSEADIVPGKQELPEIDRDISDEHSIVRILELWQAMFRDTFLHYHRLSTALVRSGDAATALKLWNEYLIDLQSFLSGSVPADYENLTEHRRLCRVHRNLLTSQRSVLMNENRDLKNKELADKFDMMTNFHNETLARIVERHDEVCTRIAAWDDYREVNSELLRWLKEMEREKEKLQLRYVHMKTIHKTLAKIQNLSEKVPEGRKRSEKLLQNHKKVLEFTEEAYGASVRIEYAGVVKRIDNLQASLDTWRDFLTRILALIGEYDTLTNDLLKLFLKTQDEINSYSDDTRLSRPQLNKAINKYTDLKTKIEKTETQIEALSVIQEQLKECLSPQDIRIVNQRIWQLRQQRADLEHQISIIIHRLQERLEVYTIFDSRLLRFTEWLTSIELRLETSNQSTEVAALDPQDLIRRINSDIQTETALKEREFEWLIETGKLLVELSKKDEKSYSKNTSKQLKQLQERWQKLQDTGRSRIAKINELLETILKLEERLTEIRLKLHTIESNLSAQVVLEHFTSKAVDEKFRDRDEIHKNIENESVEVGEVLNLCELIFNDPDVLKGKFDLRNLRTGVDIVEKKWKNICDMSEQRKNALKEIRKSAELSNSLLPKVEKKLDSIEKRVEKVETRKQRGESEDESVAKSVIKDLDALEGDVKRLEDAYSRVASSRGIELRGEGADDFARLRSAVRRWQQLRVRVDAAGADAHRQFVAAHGKAVVALAEADVRLTRALHLAPTPLDKVATLKELEGVEQELRECDALVEDADRLSIAVSTVSGVPDMVAEYRALYADVRTRLDVARAEVVGDVDSAVQVDTLKWDAALQVDTLTSKETYRVELASAVKEASESLEALRTALLQQPTENASSEELATAAKEIAKAGAKPGQTLELAKHLSELLLTECDATEDEAMLKEVESLSLRYEDLLAQAKKRELQINNLRLPHSASYALTCEHETGRLTCPLCSERNWKQLDNDLWRLEQWLQFAEATEAARTDPPEQYDALEDAIQDHREFLLDLDSHKSIVVSLNVVGAHVAAHARLPADAERVRARLAAANARWDAACERAGVAQRRLQHALVHNQQFHDIVVELVSQLAAAERGVRAREPLRLARGAPALHADFRRFSELRDELARAEPRVLALHDAAQLLRAGDAPPHAADICRRLGELRLRLQSLRKLSGVYALKLGAALARQPAAASALAAAAAASAPQLLEEEEEQISTSNLPPLDENDVIISEETEEQQLSRLQRGLRFVCRVAKASLPFQALLLLLLGAAALGPRDHTDCRAGLALEPVLRYPDGPPPL